MTKRLIVLQTLALLFFSSGCVELKQRIRLTDANTGDFSIECKIPSGMIKAIKESQSLPWLDPDTGSAAFPKAEGFRITRYRVYELDEHHHLRIEGRLTDAKKALASGKLGPFTWAHANGSGSIRMKPNDPTKKKGSMGTDKELSGVLKGFRCELILELPEEPVATTAHKRDGRTLTWLFDAQKNVDFARSSPDISAAYKAK